MKMTGSIGLTLASVVAGMVLMGEQPVRGEESQTETNAPDTNLVSETEEPIVLESAALPPDIDPDSAAADLIRMVQAGVDKSVILTYIESTLRLFSLTPDLIIYLTDIGTPADVIARAMTHDQELINKGISGNEAPSAATNQTSEATTNQPQQVTVNYFYDSLAPYGSWIYLNGYGRCWRPSVVVYNPGWQPYCDNGHWIYTDCGWCWVSGYSWGWATFHYGRWFHHSRYGWCWWPDTVWSPSWVCWRYDRNYCGWAPLPPYTEYRSGVGFVYRGSTVSVGFNFNLNIDSFTFVAVKDFCDPQPWRHRIERRDAVRIYDTTEPVHRIKYDSKRRHIVNAGIDPQEITAVTRHEIRPIAVPRDQSHHARDITRTRRDTGARQRTFTQPNRDSTQQRSQPTMRSGDGHPEKRSRAPEVTPPPASREKRSTPGYKSRPPVVTPPPSSGQQDNGNQSSGSTRVPGKSFGHAAPPAQSQPAPRTTPAPQSRKNQYTPPRTSPPAQNRQNPSTPPRTAPPQQNHQNPSAPPQQTTPQQNRQNPYKPTHGASLAPNPGRAQNNNRSKVTPGGTGQTRRANPPAASTAHGSKGKGSNDDSKK